MVGRRSIGSQALFSSLILAASVAVFSGCADPRPSASAGSGGGAPGGSKACTLCHGDATRAETAANPMLPAAPPKGTKGETDVTARAVGAHQLHLQGGSLRAGISCAECHVVPTTAAHANNKVDLTFGTLASSGGATPAWNGNSCSASYCHGEFPGGDRTNAPVWTQVRAASCGTCHGVPPAAPHPPVAADASCGTCHTGYTATTVNLSTHIDGKVDVGPLTCTSCHGDATRADTAQNPRLSAAPPRGSRGETATTTRAVGAHALHLQGASPVSCTECHVVPTSTSHGTGTAEVTFGTVATTGGASPAWNGTTCSNVYCHGTFQGGNAANAPVWTSPATTSCGTCHGVPPAAPHPQNTSCGSCHTGYTSTSVNAALHVNGRIDATVAGCTACHGDATRVATALNPDLPAAPPVDTTGATQETSPGVGAHQAHLVAGGLRPAMACSECHASPSGTHPTGTVDFTWGPLARSGGATPSFDAATLTCANYCHGATLPGGTHTRPSWVGGPVETTCGSCHGNPPASPHPAVSGATKCGACHSGNPALILDPATHVNGVLDLNLSCTSCHGDPTRAASTLNPQLAAAPPADSKGNVATTARGVGAHLRHLQAGALTAGIACAECHVVPASNVHSNGTADVRFGPLSTTGSVSPSWNGTGCAASYCHGNFKNGNTSYVPTWTAPAATTCGTCHGLPPGGTHPASNNCASCHTGYTISTVNLALHVNGVVDVANMTCTSCHGTAGRVSVAGADVNQASAPPLDTLGAATGVRVGTHGSHVNPAAAGQVYKAVGCVECHPDNAGNISHANNAINVTFASATGANLAGFTPGFVQGNGSTTQTTCTTYCHGASLNATTTRGSVATWSWNGAAADCGSCHKAPPTTANHHNAAALTTCANCHGGTVNASGAIVVAGNLHINGTIDTSTLTCTSCHGGSANAATGTRDPNVAAAPTGTGAPDTYGNTTVATANGVGVHAAHVLGARSRAVQCNACHTVPTQNVHKTGPATAGTVTFGNLANVSGGTSTYAGNGGTCSNTYCHGNFAGGAGAAATPAWKTAGTLGCTSCHGAPPALSATTHHPANTNCVACHGTGYSSTTVSATTHVDGTVTVSRTGCTLCHGDLTQTGVAATSSAAAPGFNASSADTAGNTAATFATVGAHAAHLTGTRWTAAPIACSACHAVPAANDVSHATGVGSGGARATVTFSGLAVTGAIVTAAYAGSTTASGANGAGTCSNVYCHGNFKNGATALAPSWLGGAAAASCGSCHGLPPGGTHPASNNCASCHTGYTISSVDPVKHMNGAIDVDNLTCTSCHGTSGRASGGIAGVTYDANLAAAPPVDSHASATGVLVGAHLAHVNPTASVAGATQPTGGVYGPIACIECHPNNTSTTHASNTVDLTFATAVAANLNGYTATFAQGNGTSTATTCNTYCHGARLPNGSAGGLAPAWNGAAATCSSCHGFPPTSAAHTNASVPSNATACATCHADTVNANGTIKIPGAHINGIADAVKGNACSSCHSFGMVAATSYHHVMATDPGTGYPVSNAPTLDADRNCNICHMKHEFPDKANNLRNSINSATPTASNTDAPLCLSCHEQNQQLKDITRQAADGTVRTPLVGSVDFNASAHAYAVTGQFTTGATANTFTVACVKCHNSSAATSLQTGSFQFALHDSPDRRLRAPLGRAGLADDDSAGFCYRCHSNAADALPGAKKAADANDWYGTVTTMPAGATGIFAQMQKGTPGAPSTATTSTNTLYFKPTAAENPTEPMPNAHVTPDTFAGGTWIGRSMSPGTTTTAYEAKTQNTNLTTANARWRMVTFTSPAVATAVNVPAGTWTINVYDREQNAAENAFVRYAVYKWNANDTQGTTIVAGTTFATEMGTTAAPGALQAITAAGAAVSLAVGDKIVIDLEIETSATSTAYTAGFYFGSGAPSSLVLPASVTFNYATPAVPASGRHDVGAYAGKHRPNPAEETLAYIGANKHVDCADCHDPHRSKRGNQGGDGTVTAAGTGCTNTATTLCDTAANWPVNAWVGYSVDTWSATSATIARSQIVSNTANQLTFATTTAPVAGNSYRISMRNNSGAVTAATTNTLTDAQATGFIGSTAAKAWTTNAWAGWYVHIVFGTGVGQTAQIASNTAQQLTINGTWATTPTTTSRYVISKLPNVLLGTGGVNVTAWGAGTPSAWDEAKIFNPAAGSATAIPDATTQWQVCFKCHSAANAQLTSWGSGFTDLARDFNPRNQSFHPVVAPAGSSATSGFGNTKLGATPGGANDFANGWRAGDMMTCSDCHGNDDQTGTASHGPHASAVKYILRGPNTMWPTQSNGTTRWTYTNRTTGQGTASGLFCLNCHSATLRTIPHSNRSDHTGLACTGCHLRLPHGGKVARLIRTTNTPAPYVDAGANAELNAYNHSTSLNTGSCGAGCDTGTHGLQPNTATAPVNAW